jgi:hypothetical protein
VTTQLTPDMLGALRCAIEQIIAAHNDRHENPGFLSGGVHVRPDVPQRAVLASPVIALSVALVHTVSSTRQHAKLHGCAEWIDDGITAVG